MTMDLSIVDFEKGLQHCDNLVSLYHEVLHCYLAEFSPLLDESALLHNDDEARITIHTLKSLTATIGAYKYSELVGQVFHKWPNLTDIEKRQEIRQLNHFLFAVNQKVQHYCNETSPAD